jgi:CubicO group peptidase (beta-lactamase class C family)
MRSTRAGSVVCLCFSLLLGAGCRDQSVEERFRAMPAADDVIAAGDWYRPLARVAGGTGGSLRIDAKRAPASSRFAPVLADFGTSDALAVLVVQHGGVVFEHYEAPAGPAYRFDSQSMHRAIVALLVGIAIHEGRIRGLDAAAADELPEWRGDPRAAITVRDLLYGQSGFADPPYAARIDSPGMQMFIGRDLPGLVLGAQPVSEPGRSWRGTTIEAQLLGLVLERATHRRYASYLSSRLWQPIGASTAYVRLDRPHGLARSFCCIQATARDWARIGQLMLDEGRVGARQVVERAWVRQILTPSTFNRAYGAFWLLEPTPLIPRGVDPRLRPKSFTPFDAPDVYYAGGRGGQRVYVIPSLEAVVVRFGRIRNDFDDGAFLNPVLRALRGTATHRE